MSLRVTVKMCARIIPGGLSMHPRQRLHLVLYFVFCISFISLQAGTTGKLVGRVTDASSGEGLAGVNVIIENTTMGAATDLDG